MDQVVKVDYHQPTDQPQAHKNIAWSARKLLNFKVITKPVGSEIVAYVIGSGLGRGYWTGECQQDLSSARPTPKLLPAGIRG